MIPVLMAVSFLTGPEMVFGGCLFSLGLLLGLRAKHKRFLAERQRRRDLEAKVDAYDRNAFAVDLDQVGPAQVKPVLTDLDLDGTDGFVVAPPVPQPGDYVGLRSELPRPPVAMTGERDTEAQDTELAETFDICPGCSGSLMVLDDGSRWCAQCHSFWDRPDIDKLPSARCDFNGPWDDAGLCVPVDSFDVPVLEVGWQVQLSDPEGNRCRGHVMGFHPAADGEGSIAEIDLDQSTWEDGPGYQQWADAVHVEDEAFEGPRSIPGRIERAKQAHEDGAALREGKPATFSTRRRLD